MISWNEYYINEMEKIEKTKRRLEKAFLFIIIAYIIVQIVCIIGANL